jgi:hypothetical protein
MVRKFVEIDFKDSVGIRVLLAIFTTILPFYFGFFFALTHSWWWILFAMVPLLLETERGGGQVRVYI